MKTSKIVDDILIPLDFQETDKPRFCFVVFSSKEEHIEIVLDCVERVIKEKENYEVKRLDDSLKSEDSQYKELTDLLNECSFAVVILDGLRPNVVFEYGILKGLGKPCIVLLEKEANVDVLNYFPENERIEINNPKIDINKHFSDIKDRFYIRYNKNRPKEIREKIQKEYSKLKKDIDAEFIRMIFPNKDMVEKELKDHLIKLSNISKKKKDQLNAEDEKEFRIVLKKIDEIIKEHKVKLPKYYYLTIAELFMCFDKFEDALKVIDPNIENKKEYIDLIALKAFLFVKMKKFNDALETINMGIKLSPNIELLWHNKGMILEKMERKDEALLCYKKGTQFKHACSSIHFSYGILLYENNQFTEALEQFEKALRKESTNDDYLIWKARTLEKLGNTDEAKRTVEEAICFNDNNPNAWYTLGQLTPNHKESIKYFDKALLLQPKHGGALCSKAAELSNIGNADEALKIFNKMKDLCSKAESCNTLILNIGRTLHKNKRYDEALNYVEKSLKLNNNSEALGLKAVILFDSGKRDEAIKYFKISLKIEPKDDTNWFNQACAFAKLNKIEESIESLKKAIDLNPSFKDDIESDTDFDGIRNSEKFKKEFS